MKAGKVLKNNENSINGARLSSSYGKEASILGYTKMHTGTDFAAQWVLNNIRDGK